MPEPTWRSPAFGWSVPPIAPVLTQWSARSRWKSRLIRSARTLPSVALLARAEAMATSGAEARASGRGTGSFAPSL